MHESLSAVSLRSESTMSQVSNSSLSSPRIESRRIKTFYRSYTPKQAKKVIGLSVSPTSHSPSPKQRNTPQQNRKEAHNIKEEGHGNKEPRQDVEMSPHSNSGPTEPPLYILPRDDRKKISVNLEKNFIRFSTPGTCNHTSVMVNNGCDLRSTQENVFYFEAQVIRCIKNISIAIGFSSKDGYYHGFPGFDEISFAYHGDSGSIVHDSKYIEIQQPFKASDTIGAGVILPERHLFFTLNGSLLGKFYDLTSLEEIITSKEEAKLTEASDIEHVERTKVKYIYSEGVGIIKGSWIEGPTLSLETTDDGLPAEATRELVVREKRDQAIDQQTINSYLSQNNEREVIMEPEHEDPFVLYPVIGFNAPCTIEVNIGQQPFTFDVTSLNKSEPVPERTEVIGTSFGFDDVALSPSVGGKKPTPYCLWLAASIRMIFKELLKALIDKGLDVNAYSSHLGTPLHVACKQGNTVAVSALVESPNININIIHKKKSACDYAYHIPEIRYVSKMEDEISKRMTIVKKLRELGSEMNIHTAVFCGDFEKVKKCIEVDKDYVDWQDEFYRTSLHIACAMGYLDIAEFLLNNGACSNFGNFVPPPLLIAAECLNPEMVTLLCHHRAEYNIFTEGEDKHILEHLLEKFDRFEDTSKEEMFYKTIEALCAAGSDPCLVKGSSTGSFKDHRCAMLIALDRLNLKLFALFAKYSKNVIRIRGEYDESLLHLICNCIYYNEDEERILYEMALILVKDLCVDITAKDEHGNTCVHLAAGSGMSNIIKLLLLYGAEIDSTNYDGYPPLFLAIVNKQLRSAKYLIKRGAFASYQTNKGQTILHTLFDVKGKKKALYLCELNNEEIGYLAEFCVNTLGVNENLRDHVQKTARDYAIENGLSKYFPISFKYNFK
ncbi:hypothetical protein C9374_006441 [Naegleria lovaniensis]|uniref:B30.2/SPRY domain-containing protein n=1 Tax=Naegleria lovaniensis TaxID=51637 RepID=A0AA88KHS8_NAELO|nr:uncharacterized protein C9374_006441 [Naegleria lovaniensis]KAG2381452.1 hypothetical protein C9374_006441 [Naegleria lovaniensis]